MAAAAPVLPDFKGVWILESTTGQFDEIMTEQGVGWFLRKAMTLMGMSVTISQPSYAV